MSSLNIEKKKRIAQWLVNFFDWLFSKLAADPAQVVYYLVRASSIIDICIVDETLKSVVRYGSGSFGKMSLRHAARDLSLSLSDFAIRRV